MNAPELRTSAPRRSVFARVVGFFTGFRHRDFTLVFLSRLFFFLGFFAVIDYVFYIVSDYVGPENTPFSGVNDAVAAVASINTISQVVAIVAFGWLADRLDRRKVVVALSALAMAAAFVSPIIARTGPVCSCTPSSVVLRPACTSPWTSRSCPWSCRAARTRARSRAAGARDVGPRGDRATRRCWCLRAHWFLHLGARPGCCRGRCRGCLHVRGWGVK